MAAEIRLVLMLSLPLVAITLTLLLDRRENLREAAQVLVGTLLFFVACSLAPDVFAGARPEQPLWELTPGFELRLRLEPLGMLFALVASGLWVVTTVYAMGYLRAHHETQQTRFFACFGAAIFAAMGAALAANLLTLFVFYEIMTLSTYPLVTHHGTEAAREGGRTYLSILISTSIAFLLLAIAWTWQLAGTLEFTDGGILAEPFRAGKVSRAGLVVLLALYAFGTAKAAIMPLHKWLPAAMVAPTPVSALLHAVAVVKVGVFAVMKVSLYVFGPELMRETGCSVWLMYLAGFSLVTASLIALQQDNLKRRLAYSTVSQLAYITMGAAIAQPSSVIGGAMHIAMHAVGKITLFFCAGAIYVASHKTNVSQMRGLGRKMPFTMGAFLLGSISIIGLPPCGGVWSKWFLALGAAEAEHPLLVAALMVSSLLNIAYLLPVAVLAFYAHDEPSVEGIEGSMASDSGAPQASEFVPDGETGWRHFWRATDEAPLLCVVPPCLTAVAGIGLFFLVPKLYDALLPLGKLAELLKP